MSIGTKRNISDEMQSVVIACSGQRVSAIHRKTLPGDETRSVACKESTLRSDAIPAIAKYKEPDRYILHAVTGPFMPFPL
jgi:hypothetical protein